MYMYICSDKKIICLQDYWTDITKQCRKLKEGKLNIKNMNKINKITILSDDLLSETLGGLSNRTEFSFLSII